MHTVFIDGSQGTTGLRIHERLSGRQDLRVLTLPEAQRKSLPHRLDMARSADATILCLPDDASRELVSALGETEGRILDASTAHRTDPRFAYGFPELGEGWAQRVRTSRRIAVPGCHASGAVALLKPLLDAGVLRPDAPVCLTSLTGYSGGGKKMLAQYEAPDRPACLHAPRPYALGQGHKHLPEIAAVRGLTQRPGFQPIVMDVYSGMLVSLPLTQSMLQKPLGLTDIRAIYGAFYQGAALVRALSDVPEDPLDSAAMAGTDAMEVFVTGNDDRMIAYARFDNLGKGACGAAIECLNLALGLDAGEGLNA